MGCPNCDFSIVNGDRIVAVTGGAPDEQLGYAHADCPQTIEDAPFIGARTVD